jgi:hypothetical protein
MLCGAKVNLRPGDSLPCPESVSAAQPAHSHTRTLRASDQKNGSTFLASLAADEPFIRCKALRYSSPS